jgi:hypothetical protein
MLVDHSKRGDGRVEAESGGNLNAEPISAWQTGLLLHLAGVCDYFATKVRTKYVKYTYP